MVIKLLIFDWSGVISDDRRPVYEANMAVFRDYNKAVLTFEQWLVRTSISSIEIFANHGIRDDIEREAEQYGIKLFFDYILGSSKSKSEWLKALCWYKRKAQGRKPRVLIRKFIRFKGNN